MHSVQRGVLMQVRWKVVLKVLRTKNSKETRTTVLISPTLKFRSHIHGYLTAPERLFEMVESGWAGLEIRAVLTPRKHVQPSTRT
jgi:hypothetical protein